MLRSSRQLQIIFKRLYLKIIRDTNPTNKSYILLCVIILKLPTSISQKYLKISVVLINKCLRVIPQFVHKTDL